MANNYISFKKITLTSGQTIADWFANFYNPSITNFTRFTFYDANGNIVGEYINDKPVTTGLTKQMVEDVLTGTITSHTHTTNQITDATTLGKNLVKLANGSSISFPRFNANNTVDKLNASDFRGAIGSQAIISGAASTITANNLTASRALVSDAYGKVAASGVTSTQIGYLADVTSAIQGQLNGKANLTGANFTGNVVAGAGLNIGTSIPQKGDGSTIYFGNDIKMLNQAAGATGFYVNSAKQNRFYCLTQNGNYECFSNYRGNGVYAPSSLPGGLWYASTRYLASTGESGELGRLFDNSFTTGATFPTTGLDVNPVVITIKTTDSSPIDYTDTSYLVINGWRYGGVQATNHYGTLNSYSVEICTDKVNDTWIKILERIGVSDSIAGLHIPLWSSLGGAASFTELYGIRLTIKGATQGGLAGQFGLAEIKLMENRPGGKPSDSVGALSLGGGTLYGNIVLGSKYDQFIRPANDKTHFLGSSSQQFKAVHAQYVYANGQLVYHPGNKPTAASIGAQPTINGTGFVKASGTTISFDNTTYQPLISVLPVANGGSGQSTYTNGQLLIGNSSGTLTKSTLSSGTGISITNGSGSITINNSAPNATHTGEVTGSTALTIANAAVTNAKLANMAANTIKGRVTAGVPEDLTPAQVRSIINVENGANKYIHPSITRTDETSEVSLSFGGTFTTIDSVASNGQGHITGINLKTVTLPSPSYPEIIDLTGGL